MSDPEAVNALLRWLLLPLPNPDCTGAEWADDLLSHLAAWGFTVGRFEPETTVFGDPVFGRDGHRLYRKIEGSTDGADRD